MVRLYFSFASSTSQARLSGPGSPRELPCWRPICAAASYGATVKGGEIRSSAALVTFRVGDDAVGPVDSGAGERLTRRRIDRRARVVRAFPFGTTTSEVAERQEPNTNEAVSCRFRNHGSEVD